MKLRGSNLIFLEFRIIAINNNDCYYFNFWNIYTTSTAKTMLQWLHDTLLAAERNYEWVHILMHIPMNDGSCYAFWQREFRRIIVRFQSIISGMFNGHTHYNEFNIFYAKSGCRNIPVNVAWNGGSITPFSYVRNPYLSSTLWFLIFRKFQLNPNFVMYTVDANRYVSFPMKQTVPKNPVQHIQNSTLGMLYGTVGFTGCF